MPGVAAAQGAPGNPPVGGGPGVLPPQGAPVPMKVDALGDHAVGMDIMRAIMKALPEAIRKLGPTEEGRVAAQMYSSGGKLFHSTQAGHADATDPMRQVAQAIMARRAQAGGGAPAQGPGAPVTPAMPNRGPVPMPAGAGAPA